MDKKDIKKYSELLIKCGVSLQKGQPLVIVAQVNVAPFIEELVKTAYKCGAKRVEILWEDEIVEKLGYRYRKIKDLSIVPDWQIAEREYYIDEKIAYLVILSDDPDAFKGVSVEKSSALRRARGKAFEKFRSYTSSNKIRWCIAGFPSEKWAKKMFPTLSKSKAVEMQWKCIANSVRLFDDNPIEAWKKHNENLTARCEKLNSEKIKYFYYKSSSGTDFKIGMPENYRFLGGAEEGTLDGVPFNANMPSEEVFASPDKYTAEGILVSAMPLCRNGQIIKDFYLKFKDGKIIDYGAKEGEENLKSIIETDEGSHYLGEIALIGYNSPIREMGVLFYETLYDENASCHFAIGDCYPSCVLGGEDMTKEELEKNGLNSSMEHVDFMVGTKDLSITAETVDGKIITVFKDGDWVI